MCCIGAALRLNLAPPRLVVVNISRLSVANISVANISRLSVANISRLSVANISPISLTSPRLLLSVADPVCRVARRHLSSKREALADIKTEVDKNRNVTRRSKQSGIWESVIGIEVHAQVNAASKMFSSAPTSFNAPVNSNVSFFDAAIPGTLPVLNRRCVEAGVLTSLALGLRLNHVSYFDRKHYFYADLPAGYQITQQRQALAVDGKFTFPVEGKDLPGGGKQRANTCFTKETGIVQLQLEQDSGKSLHDLEGGKSLIDLNRCGIGLMEIVFGPDLRHGEEAAGLVRELRLILERVGSCLGRMEQGELRVDANISVRRPGDELGVRTEVKNINSVRSVSQAIEYEVARQIAVLEGGGIVENETRSFDVLSRRTMPMRDKEAKQDYRFMPEPNLPPLRLCDSDVAPPTSPYMVDIAPLRMALPQLPSETRKRLESEEGLSPAIANRLVASPQLLSFYFKCTEVKPKSRKEVADLILILVTEHCNNTNQQLDQLALKPEQLVEVSNMRQEGEISHMAVKEVVAALLSGEHKEAREAVQAKGLYLIKDETVILQFVQELMNNNDKLIKQWRTSEGKKRGKALQALVSVANKDPRAERVDMAVFMRTLQNSLEIS